MKGESAAKTSATHVLRVHNWLATSQRFRVEIERSGDDADDASVTLRGAESIDVPGNLFRDYRLHFFAYKEVPSLHLSSSSSSSSSSHLCVAQGVTKARVRFVNDALGEYLFYDVTLTATEAGVLDTLALTAPVRQQARALVRIHNPLQQPVSEFSRPGVELKAHHRCR